MRDEFNIGPICLKEGLVPINVVAVIVRVDDDAHRLIGYLADFRHQVTPPAWAQGRIHNNNVIPVDDEAAVGANLRAGHGGIYAVSQLYNFVRLRGSGGNDCHDGRKNSQLNRVQPESARRG